MLFGRLVLGATLGLLLAGCNAATVQPQPAAPDDGQAATSAQSSGSAVAASEPAANTPTETSSNSPVSGARISNQLDQLSGRLALMQEQLIQLKSAGQQQAEISQILLTRLQHLSESGIGRSADADTSDLQGSDEVNAQMDAVIDQLMQTVNQLGLADAADTFAVASAYTAKGAWVLIRYRVDTGETWLADQGSWVKLDEEVGSLPASSYAVQLQRADQDLKGFVAVRIDRRSGESWWLNDRRWQVYQ